MGRWLEKIKNEPKSEPTKPAQPLLSVLMVDPIVDSEKDRLLIPESDRAIQSKILNDLIKKAMSRCSLAELEATLITFSKRPWMLCEQSAMSSAYTSLAKKLIEIGQADKYRTLKDLALLCWANRLHSG